MFNTGYFIKNFITVTIFLNLSGGTLLSIKSYSQETIDNQSKGFAIKKEKQPNSQFEKKEYDFGDVEEGEKITYIFKFKNQGDDTLVILEAKGSCKCIEVKLSSQEIPVSAEGEIKVIFDTKGHQGKVSQGISVYSNDLDEPMVKLKLIGFVKRAVIVNPQRVYFRQFFKNNPSNREVYLLKGKDRDFKILKIEADSEYINYYGPTPVVKNDMAGYKIEVSLKPQIPIGEFRSYLTIYTDNIEQLTIKLPIIANVEGELIVKPTNLIFTSIADKKIKVKNVKVFSNNLDKKIKIIKVKDDLKGYISTRITPLKEKNGSEVIVHLQDNIPQGNFKGKITIFTNYPNQPIIEIPVRIYNKKIDRK